MPKDGYVSPSSESRYRSLPITVAVEYRDPAVHRSSSLPDKIIQDLTYLGLPRPSPANIQKSIGDWVDVRLTCLPFELQRLKALEFSHDKAMSDVRDYCGIKRMWRLSRLPYQRPNPTMGSLNLKRSIVISDADEDVQKKKKTEPGPPLRIIHPLESGSTSPSVTSSQSTPMVAQEGTSVIDRHIRSGQPGRPQAQAHTKHNSSAANNAIQDFADDIVLLRMLPLDQTQLVESCIKIDGPVAETQEPSMQTRDPRRLASTSHASPGKSREPQKQDGYPAETQILLVDSFEKHPRGWETKLRRLFQREQRRQLELQTPIELERDEARRRAERLENELQDMRQMVQEIRIELESRKVRNVDLEAKIESMRKECQHPFVVPGLIDAFLKMGDWEDVLTQD